MTRAEIRLPKTAGFALAFATTVLAMVAVPLSANAAPIAATISNVATTTTGITQNGAVSFTGNWAIPNNSNPLDTFDMQLPAELLWQGAATFNLIDDSPTAPPAPGNVVAIAQVDASGHVVFTLTDYVVTHPNNVNGTFSFETRYTDTITTGGSKDLEFILNGEVTHVTVDLADPCTADCNGTAPTEAQKYMGWLNAEQTKLLSVIDVPPLTEDAATVVITDTPQAGSTIDCTHVFPAVGVYDNINGVIPSGPNTISDQYPPTVDCHLDHVTVTWNNIPAGNALQLMLWSDVSDHTLKEYKNDALVTINGVPGEPLHATAISSRASGTGIGDTVGGIAVTKVDSANASTFLAGAIFDVRLADGTSAGTLGPTAADGTATVSGLTPGTYTLVETTAPAGYVLDSAPITVTVTGGSTTPITVENVLKTVPVIAEPPAAPTPDEPLPTVDTPTLPALAATGSEAGAPLGLGVVVLLLGAAFVLAARTKRMRAER